MRSNELPELRPCPFCGAAAKFEDGGFNAIRVTCSDYDCVQRQRVHKADRKCHAKLAEHWNKRTEELEAAAEVVRLRGAMEQAHAKFEQYKERHIVPAYFYTGLADLRKALKIGN
jgi:hypothetical protein